MKTTIKYTRNYEISHDQIIEVIEAINECLPNESQITLDMILENKDVLNCLLKSMTDPGDGLHNPSHAFDLEAYDIDYILEGLGLDQGDE